jgi:phosphatidylserine decarboxylase
VGLESGTFRDKKRHIPFAREGIPFVLMFAFTTLILAILGCSLLAGLLLVLTLLVGHFFRDPERVLTADDRDLASPADGKVILIEKVDGTCFAQTPSLKISVFMSVFDVHVSRIPISGRVRGVHSQKGRFLAAQPPRPSHENEQNWVWIQSETGVDVVVTQVAGMIARRIVCWPTVGDRVIQGERCGLIRFGSRLDIYVPEGSEILVARGEHVYAGETILCRLK